MTVEITRENPSPIKSIKATCIYAASDHIVASPRMDDDEIEHLRAKLEEARLDEREVCARVAEGFATYSREAWRRANSSVIVNRLGEFVRDGTAHDIAYVIRARTIEAKND